MSNLDCCRDFEEVVVEVVVCGWSMFSVELETGATAAAETVFEVSSVGFVVAEEAVEVADGGIYKFRGRGVALILSSSLLFSS